jgi:uncharacterized protein YnzC (UPF0291/DUF896 family)
MDNEKIINRINNLLAKTVENGCTPEEAAAAAAKAQELIAKYQENFTSEGTPVNASVDVTKIDGLEITDGVSMTAESLKALVASESFNSSDDSAWTL